MNLPPQERYQFKPFPFSSHSWALERLAALDPGAKVLDVGPGSSAFGKILAEKGLTELYAVEIDEEARRHAEPMYKEVRAELSELSQRKFDCVLLLDVIEHMAEPEEFLESLKSYLSEDALILVSVPNIAHWSIRLGLLLGQFEYKERGILDKTHLQFFTVKRTRELEKLGFRLQELNGSLEPVEYFLPEFLWSSVPWRLLSTLRHGLCQLLPGLMSFQVLAELKWSVDKGNKE